MGSVEGRTTADRRALRWERSTGKAWHETSARSELRATVWSVAYQQSQCKASDKDDHREAEILGYQSSKKGEDLRMDPQRHSALLPDMLLAWGDTDSSDVERPC